MAVGVKKNPIKTQEARDLGKRIADLIEIGRISEGYALLTPVLSQRTPFRMLGLIGEAVGDSSLDKVNDFLEIIASDKTEGGWVVMACALGRQLERDFWGVFERCHTYITSADIWYATDIFGERVPGPALLADFDKTLSAISPWREDDNRWIRRTVGVAVHFWAKRSKGEVEYNPKARILLDFLDPMFEESDMDAVKGIGWGLKTLGRYYSGLVADWLVEQVVNRQRKHRTLMLRKSLTYLSEEQKARVI